MVVSHVSHCDKSSCDYTPFLCGWQMRLHRTQGVGAYATRVPIHIPALQIRAYTYATRLVIIFRNSIVSGASEVMAITIRSNKTITTMRYGSPRQRTRCSQSKQSGNYCVFCWCSFVPTASCRTRKLDRMRRTIATFSVLPVDFVRLFVTIIGSRNLRVTRYGYRKRSLFMPGVVDATQKMSERKRKTKQNKASREGSNVNIARKQERSFRHSLRSFCTDFTPVTSVKCHFFQFIRIY